MPLFDTQEMRATARRISGIANDINQVGRSKVPQILGEMPGNFEGDAARALEEQLMSLRSDTIRIAGDWTASAGS